MPTSISDEELERVRQQGSRIDTFEFRDPDDEDNYVIAALHKFGADVIREIESSGMNSRHAGAGNIGERLTAEEAEEWTKVLT